MKCNIAWNKIYLRMRAVCHGIHSSDVARGSQKITKWEITTETGRQLELFAHHQTLCASARRLLGHAVTLTSDLYTPKPSQFIFVSWYALMTKVWWKSINAYHRQCENNITNGTHARKHANKKAMAVEAQKCTKWSCGILSMIHCQCGVVYVGGSVM